MFETKRKLIWEYFNKSILLTDIVEEKVFGSIVITIYVDSKKYISKSDFKELAEFFDSNLYKIILTVKPNNMVVEYKTIR